MRKNCRKAGLAGGIVALAAAVGFAGVPARAQQTLPGTGLPRVSLGGPCLLSGMAYLRARIRGAVRLDVDLHGPDLACEGGPRLNGQGGIRMGFEGRARPSGRDVRMVFGIDGAREGRPGRELPTNLTVIFEGEKLLFATQGDGNCTVDRLTQEPLSAGQDRARSQREAAKTRSHPIMAKDRSYLITAHGFCIAPVNDIGGHRRILVTTFDFAGRADFDTR